ncbi:MAG: HEPN domain-containing protein [Patescibacteria group bacterium]|nr:HEPN domain-containing protein [Patescibacteria group bacterium]
MNRESAKEWLIKSWHNLSTAKILFDVNHYTDVIAVDLHNSCEKALKALIAYQNKKIPKTNSLIEISKDITSDIDLSDNFYLLKQISKYHIEESYPVFNRALPSRDEIKEVLEFSQKLFEKVCNILDIELAEVQV